MINNDYSNIFHEKGDFFKSEATKEKYEAIKDGKGRNNHFFIEKETDLLLNLKSNIPKHYMTNFIKKTDIKNAKKFKIYFLISFIFLIFCIFLNTCEGPAYGVINLILACFFIGFNLLSHAKFLYKSNDIKTEDLFLYYCLEDKKIKEILCYYFYSPNIPADKVYIQHILTENKTEHVKIEKVNEVINKNKYITYLELNRVFGLLRIEEQMINKCISHILKNEYIKNYENSLSKEIITLLK